MYNKYRFASHISQEQKKDGNRTPLSKYSIHPASEPSENINDDTRPPLPPSF